MHRRDSFSTAHAPVHHTDRLFFAAYPRRRFLARPYADGDGPIPFWITLFADDGAGALGEINLVIVGRIAGGRVRALFSTSPLPRLKTDRAIVRFLKSRNVDPNNPLSWVPR